MRGEEMGFEQAMQEEEDAGPGGRVDAVVADVGERPAHGSLVLEEVLQVGVGDVLRLMVPA